ncbi:MAG: hypothetical protein II574_08685, partial [Ruminococcus sp.]|nr:hypothetical protein [Ruminococcus sp.]
PFTYLFSLRHLNILSSWQVPARRSSTVARCYATRYLRTLVTSFTLFRWQGKNGADSGAAEFEYGSAAETHLINYVERTEKARRV